MRRQKSSELAGRGDKGKMKLRHLSTANGGVRVGSTFNYRFTSYRGSRCNPPVPTRTPFGSWEAR
jgi:hypothetical protein